MLVKSDVSGHYLFRTPMPNEWIQARVAETLEILNKVGPIKTAVDIGASTGYISILCAKSGAEVWAFEPNQTNYDMLLDNLKLNSVSTVHPNPIAIGPTGATELTLRTLDEGLEQAGSFYPSGRKIGQFKCIPLLQVFSMVPGVIDYFKIDIEGMERFTVPELTEAEVSRVRWFDIENHFEDQGFTFDELFNKHLFVKETEKLWRNTREIC